MAQHIAYSSAIVNLDSQIVDCEEVADEWYCSDECTATTVADMFENYWCQHPTVPNVLIGEQNEMDPGHVFVATVTKVPRVEPTGRTISCMTCGKIIAVSVQDLL